MTKLPIFGLYDEHGQCHHAFVLAPDGRGIDGRGLQRVDDLKKGCAGTVVKPLTIQQIEAEWLKREISPSELRNARAEINKSLALRTAIAVVQRQQIIQSQFPDHPRDADGVVEPVSMLM